ncbi:MAG TPA: ATP-binding cassette domain-containing protein, partial [Tepidisphaeraceae bacterium]|nr:ATP-binding cassette domain-containing protein [Tepidisphaeraceae bacterium]
MSQALQQPRAAPTQSTIVHAVGLRKSYWMGGVETHVLESVDLTVAAGEFIAIEGRSGSGKSTLLHLLGTLDAPDAGSIEFDGQDLARLSGVQCCRLRNKQFGFVFQFYHLLPEL